MLLKTYKTTNTLHTAYPFTVQYNKLNSLAFQFVFVYFSFIVFIMWSDGLWIKKHWFCIKRKKTKFAYVFYSRWVYKIENPYRESEKVQSTNNEQWRIEKRTKRKYWSVKEWLLNCTEGKSGRGKRKGKGGKEYSSSSRSRRRRREIEREKERERNVRNVQGYWNCDSNRF